MISIQQFKPVSCLIAGGNLYDKILRQKDKLFEEEVIHISMVGSQNCNVLYSGSVLTLPTMKSIFFPFVHTSSRLWLTFMRKETSNKEAVYSCFLNGLPPHHDSLWAFFSGCYCILVCPVFYTFAFFPDFFLHVCFTVLYFILTLELLYDDLLFLFTPYHFSLPVQPASKRCQVMLNHNFWLQLPSFYLFEKEYLNQIFVCFQSKYNLFFLCRWWCGICFRLFQQ